MEGIKHMRRWNGWGDPQIGHPLPAGAISLLELSLGSGSLTPDVEYETVLNSVPVSTLPPHDLLSTDAEVRLRHARGQSLPDWIALRTGEIDTFPDAVASPTCVEEIRDLFKIARRTDAIIIPYGGGTSVVGHINPPASEKPVITLDTRGMNQMMDFDELSHLATFQAGASGPEIEKRLGELGYTLGHFPQSWEQSTLGGWIATRSSGQQSLLYGRIESLFAGGHIETPVGEMDIRALPASAAGPDLREFILGSEGRFGVITDAVVRVSPIPEREIFRAVFFKDFTSGVRASHALAQELPLASMIRLSDAQETATTLALSGKETLINLADFGLRLVGHEASKRCLMIYALTGSQAKVRDSRSRVKEIVRAFGGLPIDPMIGDLWKKSRFKTPYLRNTLWDHGYAIDTLETALSWSRLLDARDGLKSAIEDAFSAQGSMVLVLTHISHIYKDGAGIYLTYIFPRVDSARNMVHMWHAAKTAASQYIMDMGGTISHQHGVGVDHKPFLNREKGAVGMSVLEAVRKTLDPDGMLNPGKLL